MKIMSEAAYSRHRGVARKTVGVWKSRGLLVWAEGGIAVAETDKILDARPQSFKGGKTNRQPGSVPEVGADLSEAKPSDAGSWTLAEAQRLKENALAATRMIGLEKLRGNIILAEHLEPAWAKIMTGIRAHMTAIPGRAQLMAGLTAEQTGIVRKLIFEALRAAATDTAPPCEGYEPHPIPAE